MYFDARLWAFTRGMRGRIAGTVLIGVLAAATGIARLALLGWLIGRIYAGAPASELVGIGAAIVAVIAARGVLMSLKETTAQATAAPVQRTLRRRLHAPRHVPRPGHARQDGKSGSQAGKD